MFESVIPIVTSIGGGFTGVIIGYFVKKIIKILMFVAGGIFGLLLYLQQQEIISISFEKVEPTSTFIVTTLGSLFDNVTHIGGTTSLGIPVTGGRRQVLQSVS